jgi:fructuronate reductase
MPLARFVEQLMRDDIAPAVVAPPGLDLPGYIADVLARFANPAIRHLLSQIAWDGSQKLPYRLLGTVREALEAGRPIDRLAVPIAAWLRFLEKAAHEGRTITDPLAEELLGRAADWRAVLAMPAVFGPLGHDARFIAAVGQAREALAQGSLPG